MKLTDIYKNILTESKAKVELTPLGNKIKYRITGKIFCKRMEKEIPNSGTFDITDLVWKNVFSDNVALKKFIKRNKTMSAIINLGDLGYDQCDYIKS